ncbi:MAG TPA: hypothetical protein VHV78_15550 [Gemmatimonadaceae bacterium]|jgi:hypothetical protein|nr:hypothetical protein [Gemmatimonadaceae bacterium]
MMLRRFLSAFLAAAIAAPGALAAQSIFDIGARLAPQYHSYTIDGTTNTKVSEFSLPIYVLVPISSMLNVDVGSAYAQSQVSLTTNGTKSTSTISGLTDTQIRANLSLGTDFIVVTGGVNLPTGQSTVPVGKQLAADLIGSDFLAFPIATMGSGFGGTGGIAMAQQIGGDWNLGLGLSVRKSAQYSPFDNAGGPVLQYQPGNEYRGRIGLDHAVGTGRFVIGAIYSKFDDDNLAGSIYNTGNRLISTLGFNNTYGPGQVTIAGWDLFRASGELPDTVKTGAENIGDGSIAYAIQMGGGAVFEPNVEGRFWTQQGLSVSGLATFGVRMQFNLGGLLVMPGVGYSVGQIASQDVNGFNITNTLTGLHGMLAIRLR